MGHKEFQNQLMYYSKEMKISVSHLHIICGIMSQIYIEHSILQAIKSETVPGPQQV